MTKALIVINYTSGPPETYELAYDEDFYICERNMIDIHIGKKKLYKIPYYNVKSIDIIAGSDNSN
jgi:hypothetical protein